MIFVISKRTFRIVAGILFFVVLISAAAIFGQPRADTVDLANMTPEEVHDFHERGGALLVDPGLPPVGPLRILDTWGEYVVLHVVARSPAAKHRALILFMQEKVAEMEQYHKPQIAELYFEYLQTIDGQWRALAEGNDEEKVALQFSLRQLRWECDAWQELQQSDASLAPVHAACLAALEHGHDIEVQMFTLQEL